MLACLAALAGLAARVGDEPAAAAPARSPNFVVIQTDDQALQTLRATWLTPNGQVARVMPHSLDRIAGPGISFDRYYASYPLCCPSRATLLSGRYAHSHGVISNDAPRGGWPGYEKKAVYRHNLGVWLQRAGYRTAHFGKYLNHYGDAEPEATVPPGWNRWVTNATDASSRLYYGYLLNDNGEIRGPFGDPGYDATSGKDDPGCPHQPPPFASCDHQVDSMTRRAVGQISTWAPGRPFYLQLDYVAPHGDRAPPIGPEPAARHYDSAVDTPLPRPPGFNEGDVSDKPSFIRDAPRLDQLTIRRIRIEYQKGLESLRSVDDGVGRILNALRRSGELSRTYVILTSDNGFFYGQHRLERSKFLPYEAANHLPLLIRGPGIRSGSRSNELVANIDLAPTILQLAGARADRRLDGRSLIPFWTDPSRRSRRPILLESFAKATDIDPDRPAPRTPRRGATVSIPAPVENYLGVRLGPYVYVEYETGDRELYDLTRDPFQLNNRVRDPRFDRIQGFLRGKIGRLEGCSGRECRFTTRPLPAPGR